MNTIQTAIVVLFGGFSFTGLLLGLKNCLKRRNPYGLTQPYNLIGSFVWTDAVVFGLFWSITCLVVLLLSNWLLFLLTFSVFWLMRSIGETIYWFNQQFAEKNRNPFHTLWFSRVFPGDSVWVAMQIFWQCVAVAAAISTLYILRLWFTNS
jgi:hypothetical protein